MSRCMYILLSQRERTLKKQKVTTHGSPAEFSTNNVFRNWLFPAAASTAPPVAAAELLAKRQSM